MIKSSSKLNPRKVSMQHNTFSFSLAQKTEPFIFDVDSLFYHLDCLTDRRKPKGVRYPLAIALVFVILAKLAGEDEPEGIAHWTSLRKQMLIEALQCKRHTTPHASTFSRILAQAVEIGELQQAVTQFLLSTVAAGLSVEIPLDGKTLRGTIPPGQTQGVHLLAAYLPGEGIVLMQVEVGSKENEIVAAPKVLRSLDLKGKVVTGDAMFAQRELSELVVKSGGEYVWTVKDNQASLRVEIEAAFEIEAGRTALPVMKNDFSQAETVEKGHGRIEVRRLTATSQMKGYLAWPHLEQVFKIEREVEEISSGKQRQEVSYGVSSLTREEASAARLMEIVRGHWGIENGLHYRKDKTLREDACRLRRGEAAQAMAVINNLIVGLVLRQGRKNLAEARRHYGAYPLEGLNLILRRWPTLQ
jgi:predicted transposase YbfD/YdcC